MTFSLAEICVDLKSTLFFLKLIFKHLILEEVVFKTLQDEFLIVRYFPSVMMDNVDQNLMTFILTAVCSPSYFKNPYLVAKVIEILFVINPSVQVRIS